ncbi:MAG: HAD-IIA family hydrolase [Candidatus ainarchaeum sp.]|nr:HAD-IIA family hydrolase [Candidatus ainarchaeum sp.]
MIKAVIFDLDGTLYRGKTPLPGAAETLDALRGRGVKALFLTNAATMGRAEVAAKLNGMGLRAKKEDVYCGAYLLARYIAQNHKGNPVYVVGEKGIFDELKEMGITTVEEGAGVVAVGLDRRFTYDKLAKAHLALKRGAVFLASNTDATFPVEGGELPGAGGMVAAIEKVSGKRPHVTGKPNPYVMELIEKEHGLKKQEIMVVGDRLETDIAFARNCGVKSALVLSGASKKEDIRENGMRPDYVFGSVAELISAVLP